MSAGTRKECYAALSFPERQFAMPPPDASPFENLTDTSVPGNRWGSEAYVFPIGVWQRNIV